jgi:GMP synthase-like glutamine amidotransferase
MAQQKIHVAALDADIPCLSVYKERGLYSSQFRTLLQNAAQRMNKSPEQQQNGPLSVHVTAFDAVGGSLPPLETLRTPKSDPRAGTLGPIDAIIITGSGFSAYESLPWIHELQLFIQTVYTHYSDVKIFGSCFGHQIIAQALLSSNDTTSQSTFHVDHSPTGYEMGIQPIALDPSFTAVFPPLARANPFRIQLIHGDRVVPTPEALAAGGMVSLPAPWSNIGSSAQCAIQGLYNPGRVLTYQGHFEFDTFVNSELVIEFGRRANWPAGDVASYLEQINQSFVPGKEDDDDAKAAAEAVLFFFAGSDRVVSNGLMTPPLG